MTCKTPLKGSAVPLQGPPFPPYATRRTAHFAIGATTATIEFEAERDTLIQDLITQFRTALDAGTYATLDCTYCNTTILRAVDEQAFNIGTFHHAQFRCAVAENKRLRITITLSAAQVAAKDIDIDLVGVQGNGCCRGPNSCLAAPVAGACCGQMGGGGDLVGEDYPPYSTTLVVTTNAAGEATIDFAAERDTLFLDLIQAQPSGAVFPVPAPNLRAEYCNTIYADDVGLDVWGAATFNHGMFVAGVAENKRLHLTLTGPAGVVTYLLTLTGVQGNGCCR